VVGEVALRLFLAERVNFDRAQPEPICEPVGVDVRGDGRGLPPGLLCGYSVGDAVAASGEAPLGGMELIGGPPDGPFFWSRSCNAMR